MSDDKDKKDDAFVGLSPEELLPTLQAKQKMLVELMKERQLQEHEHGRLMKRLSLLGMDIENRDKELNTLSGLLDKAYSAQRNAELLATLLYEKIKILARKKRRATDIATIAQLFTASMDEVNKLGSKVPDDPTFYEIIFQKAHDAVLGAKVVLEAKDGNDLMERGKKRSAKQATAPKKAAVPKKRCICVTDLGPDPECPMCGSSR